MNNDALLEQHSPLLRGAMFAILAAAAFGITTPLIKMFGAASGPISTAMWLYAGATAATLVAPGEGGAHEAPVQRAHLARLLWVALAGAVVAPICLAWGLQRTTSSAASLLLNAEAVFTVFLAWRLNHEPIGVRVALAVMAMVAGGACLVIGGRDVAGFGWGAASVVLATFAWAMDNALTRPLADLNPTHVVRWKSALGAGIGLLLSIALKETFPNVVDSLGLLVCGATGYGLSLRLYLRAQRAIGAARTGSIFALAPFVGAATSWAMGDRSGGVTTAAAAGLFGLGVYLHLTERHRHLHWHETVEHEHAHRHDDGHHDHVHEQHVSGEHSHLHRHEARMHDHPHAPDLHHQHRHEHESPHD